MFEAFEAILWNCTRFHKAMTPSIFTCTFKCLVRISLARTFQ
ncbi:hypothetical protein AvCA_17890 [Azotobacter vinelandii CA]|uniref:Uncharacterized protein n=2 Tax=Azotobacter vinelandii TaxID=354 RepID=C1DDN1_AZOVD|nr:hypothetical protein Avin_17890 [Azotobacter vinelandii DJ]AGK16899.1 hypothetical protein AvCA_17890 [Azotobacter vinelandii CA]AGK20161.1 hypothetical protein AvCA6_17890 [Azotobacter vinelandii CA6]